MAKKPTTEGLVQRVYVVLPPEVPGDVELPGVRLTRTGAEALSDTVPGSSIKKVYATK